MPPTGRVYVNPNGANIYIEGEDTGDTSSDRFIGRSGSILPDPAYFSSSSNTSDPFIQTSFIYANKVFKEWNTFRDGSGNSYSIGEIINTTISTTLFAIWEEIPYNVTISYKGSIIAGMSSSGTAVLDTAGTYCEDDITIEYTKPSGGVTAGPNDVNFIDYDGTLLYSYTASEFANLSALPANPSHEGLVAQGWNWSLANAKTYVASYGKLWIGQMYITESGDTEIDVELHAPRLSPWLSLAINGTVEVDWGDGSTKSTVTGTSLTTQVKTGHVYTVDGSYTIKIHVVSGSFSLYGSSTYAILSGNFSSANNNRVYANNVQRVRIGSSVTGIGSYTFYSCYSLASITIPSGVTSIGTYAFSSCFSLASITIPSGVTSIETYVFRNCNALASITIPSGVTSIGTYAFSSCSSLASITIPSSVTSIETYVFSNCYALASITIPSGVTSISQYIFGYCGSLASITIPSGVTSISNSAFYSCYGLGLIRFEPTTPPTVVNSSAWTNIPTDCIILIPYNSDSYIGATNYPSSSTYSYVGYMTSVSGESLPSETSSVGYILDWYATKEEAASGTGTRLTQGNGNEIYCDYTQIASGGTND